MTFTEEDVSKHFSYDEARYLVFFEVVDNYKKESWIHNGESTSLWLAKKVNDVPVVTRIVESDEYDGNFDELWNDVREEAGNYGFYDKDLGMFEVVNTDNLGDGKLAWEIYRHLETGRLFRREGYYSSWDSGEMEDHVVEVDTVEVKVVRYKNVRTGEVYSDPVL